jgi:uncharacterized protein (TIGR00251 family)
MAITPRSGGVRFDVHVQPRAKRNELAGKHGDAIKVRLTAAPADGAANEGLIALLADAFAVPGRSIRIISGARSRAKIVEIDGIEVDDVQRRISDRE